LAGQVVAADRPVQEFALDGIVDQDLTQRNPIGFLVMDSRQKTVEVGL